MRGQARFHWVLALCVGAALSACDEKKQAAPPTRTESQAPPPSVDRTPQEPAPWFVGEWTFQGKLKSIPSALALDEADRARASGKEPAPTAPASEESLQVALKIDPKKQVQGTATLGGSESEVRATFEQETLRVRIVAPIWNGHLVATKSGAAFLGEVRASRLVGESRAPDTEAFVGEIRLVRTDNP